MNVRSRIVSVLSALMLAAAAPRAAAHQDATVAAGITFGRDATYRLDLVLDSEHLPPLPPPTAGSGLLAHVEGMTPGLETRFGPFVRVFLERGALSFDGRRVRPESAKIVAEGDADSAPNLRLLGTVPTGSKAFTFSSGFDAGTFVLRLAAPGADEPVRQWLKGNETSRPFPLDSRVVPESRAAVVRGYFVMGFRHILPDGVDHILFVLGLFLLSPRLKPLLVQVTSFTAAHTLALALAALGFVSLPPRVVEPLIALSIVYVALENVVTPRLTPWRPAVVFGFGLLHGMGFAGALREAGLPRPEIAAALLSFNAGVEGGQLAVILAAFVVLALPFRARPWYRSRIVVAGSLLIAAVGLFWLVQRILSPA
ncbi:MAG: HupE/UreJ family protein [Thermoanaerobaculia bacterium]|nr:HupE/UreJ family protein [Thermoanaerobaculia bacterium]